MFINLKNLFILKMFYVVIENFKNKFIKYKIFLLINLYNI